MRDEQLYEEDFFAWTQLKAEKLRRFARPRPNLPLDLPHIAEEIAELGHRASKQLGPPHHTSVWRSAIT